MGWFDRGKKRPAPPPPAQAPAPRAQPDFLSPLWTAWPPTEPAAAPVPITVPIPVPMPEPPPPSSDMPEIVVVAEVMPSPPPPRPPVVTPAPAPPVPALPPHQAFTPPPVPHFPDTPPLPNEPAVVVQRIRQISEPPPPARKSSKPVLVRAPSVPPPMRPLSAPPAARASRPAPGASPTELMRMSMAAGDWISARAIADKVLAYDPTDLDAHACVETCNRQMSHEGGHGFAEGGSRLGDRRRVLRIAVPQQWLASMSLGPRIAYLLSRIDGVSSIEAILDVCGMPEHEGVATLLDLLEQGVLEVRPPLPRQSSRPPR